MVITTPARSSFLRAAGAIDAEGQDAARGEHGRYQQEREE